MDNHRRNCSTSIFGTTIINILCKITYCKSNVAEVWQKIYGKRFKGIVGVGEGVCYDMRGYEDHFPYKMFPNIFVCRLENHTAELHLWLGVNFMVINPIT